MNYITIKYPTNSFLKFNHHLVFHSAPTPCQKCMKISLRSTHLWNVFNLKVVRSAFFKFIAMEIFVSSTGQSMF